MSKDIHVTVPQTATKSDTMATLIGAAQAAAVGIGDFLVHTGTDGVLHWGTPTFWLGIVIAMLSGLQGYYSNKGTTTQVTTHQTGTDSTVNVAVEGEAPKAVHDKFDVQIERPVS